MDELGADFERIIVRCGLGLSVFSAIMIIGFISSKFRSSKNSEAHDVKDYNVSKEPMSSDRNIGETSMRLGEDARDVWGKGYSDDQINGVLTGKYTLEDLYKMKPEGNDRVS